MLSEDPISDTQTVPSFPSLMLEGVCALLQLAHVAVPKMQNSVSGVQVEEAVIGRPAARLPRGGKQPRSMGQTVCPLMAARNRKRRRSGRGESECRGV